jgi:hypothetical protein
MPIPSRKTNKFLNSREWRTFLGATQAAGSPSMARAVRAGQAWLTGPQDAGDLSTRCTFRPAGTPPA